jgi:hypothetical protein
LNAFVLAAFAKNPARTEPEIFLEYTCDYLGLRNGDVNRFRELCLTSARAILKGRHCAAFDCALGESVLPTACWMRDDRLGGHHQLAEVFDYLQKNNLVAEALAEKAEAVRLWERVALLACQIEWRDRETAQFVKVSAEYGCKLFRVVATGWRAMLTHKNSADGQDLESALADYGNAWADYQSLALIPGCPTLYHGKYFNLPGQPDVPGLAASIADLRRRISTRATAVN